MKIVLTAVLFASVSLIHAQEWSRFRGPNGSGVSPSAELPVRFGPDDNLLWKVDVPFGSSSPVLTDDAVIVSGAEGERLYVLAVDRTSGEVRWKCSVAGDRKEEVFPANDSASPSPVTDGKNVYVFFPEMGLLALDTEGKELWRHRLGPFVSFYGMSSSPILVGETLILLCDQQSGSFLVAVDKASGEQVWRVDRSGIIECWTTPVVYPADAPEEVIVFGSYFITSYSIDSGEERWRMKGFGYTPVCSPTLDGDRLYVSVPNHGDMELPDWDTLAEQVDANKDGRLDRTEVTGELGDHFGWADIDKDDIITQQEWDAVYMGMKSKDYGLVAVDLRRDGGPREVWRYKKALPSIASPLLYEGVIYLARDGGLVTRIDASNGELLSRERLPDGMGECWPSPVAAGGRVYIVNNEGKIAVISTEDDWNVLETNDLGEECLSTPAIGGDVLYVRTKAAIWAFGKERQGP